MSNLQDQFQRVHLTGKLGDGKQKSKKRKDDEVTIVQNNNETQGQSVVVTVSAAVDRNYPMRPVNSEVDILAHL